MKAARIVSRLLVSLWVLTIVFGVPAGAQAAARTAPVADECTTVEFYIYNATPTSVFVDITNWSDYTRALLVLEPGQSGRFELAPGSFEFWASSYDGHWDLSGGDVYQGCTRVAIYIKNVKGPVFKVHATSTQK